MPSLEGRLLTKGENIQVFILIGGHLLTQKGYLPSIVVVHIGLEHPFLGCLGNELLDTGLYFIVPNHPTPSFIMRDLNLIPDPSPIIGEGLN